MAELTKVSMDGTGHGPAALQCEYEGARYHLWIDSQSLAPVDSVLYKNPSMDDLNAFKTRRLDQGKGVGKIITPQLLAAAPGLKPVFLENLKEKAAKEDAELAENRRVRLVRDASQEVFEALRAVLKIVDPSLPGAAEILKNANAAIAKATGAPA